MEEETKVEGAEACEESEQGCPVEAPAEQSAETKVEETPAESVETAA